jgi:hypothetical protein
MNNHLYAIGKSLADIYVHCEEKGGKEGGNKERNGEVKGKGGNGVRKEI